MSNTTQLWIKQSQMTLGQANNASPVYVSTDEAHEAVSNCCENIDCRHAISQWSNRLTSSYSLAITSRWKTSVLELSTQNLSWKTRLMCRLVLIQCMTHINEPRMTHSTSTKPQLVHCMYPRIYLLEWRIREVIKLRCCSALLWHTLLLSFPISVPLPIQSISSRRNIPNAPIVFFIL